MTITKLLCPSGGEGQISAPKPPNSFRRGQKRSKISKTVSFKKYPEAHQIDPRNVLDAKMYVGMWGITSFSRVKRGENWPNRPAGRISLRHCVIGGGGGIWGRGRTAPFPPLYPSLRCSGVRLLPRTCYPIASGHSLTACA